MRNPPTNFVGYGRGKRNRNRRRTAGYSVARQGDATAARKRAEERAARPSNLEAWYDANAGRPGVTRPTAESQAERTQRMARMPKPMPRPMASSDTEPMPMDAQFMHGVTGTNAQSKMPGWDEVAKGKRGPFSVLQRRGKVAGFATNR